MIGHCPNNERHALTRHCPIANQQCDWRVCRSCSIVFYLLNGVLRVGAAKPA